MKTAILRRSQTGDTGTFGTLEVDGMSFHTGELPWRDNVRQKSCVPAGDYLCKWSKSPKFGWVYKLQDVPGRSDVLIHAGNWCGDVDQGYASDVLGCILLGSAKGMVENAKKGFRQYGLSGSRISVERFTQHMAQQDFMLMIIDEYLETGEPTVGDVA